MTTALSVLRDSVRMAMGDYYLRQTATASGDASRTVFMLPDGNLETGSLAVYVDDALQTVTTHYTCEDTTGKVTFVTAPASGTDNIDFTYNVAQHSDSEVDEAINRGIYKVWPYVAPVKMDTSTITLDSQTYEYALPSDCAYLKRVDYQSTTGQPYKVEHGWRVVDNVVSTTVEAVTTITHPRYLYLYSPQATGTLRLHYIANPVELSSDADTLEDQALIPTRYKSAVIYYACASLKHHQILRRSSANQFHNAEKANVVKLYELQRVATYFEQLAQMECDRAAISPRVRTF